MFTHVHVFVISVQQPHQGGRPRGGPRGRDRGGFRGGRDGGRGGRGRGGYGQNGPSHYRQVGKRFYKNSWRRFCSMLQLQYYNELYFDLQCIRMRQLY